MREFWGLRRSLLLFPWISPVSSFSIPVQYRICWFVSDLYLINACPAGHPEIGLCPGLWMAAYRPILYIAGCADLSRIQQARTFYHRMDASFQSLYMVGFQDLSWWVYAWESRPNRSIIFIPVRPSIRGYGPNHCALTHSTLAGDSSQFLHAAGYTDFSMKMLCSGPQPKHEHHIDSSLSQSDWICP